METLTHQIEVIVNKETGKIDDEGWAGILSSLVSVDKNIKYEVAAV